MLTTYTLLIWMRVIDDRELLQAVGRAGKKFEFLADFVDNKVEGKFAVVFF